MLTRSVLPLLLCLAALFTPFSSPAAQGEPTEQELAEIKKVLQSLQWKEGQIPLEGGAVNVNLLPGYKFLGGRDASLVLNKIWGNPPSTQLGMFFPEGKGPLDSEWAVIIEGFEEEGYVKDEDAGKIDAGKLLKEIQEGQREANKARREQGYDELEILGWAIPPSYDASAKKLYWALDLQRVGSQSHSVNYFVRILGRRGYLVVNILGGLDHVEEIKAKVPELLGMIEFNEGHRYTDFNPNTDKVAAYGLAGLILGGVGLKTAAKLGFLALLLKKFGAVALALKKLWIFIIAGGIALFGKLRSMLAGRNKAEDPTA